MFFSEMVGTWASEAQVQLRFADFFVDVARRALRHGGEFLTPWPLRTASATVSEQP